MCGAAEEDDRWTLVQCRSMQAHVRWTEDALRVQFRVWWERRVVHSPDDLSIRPIQQEIDRPQANIADARNGSEEPIMIGEA